MRNVGIKEFPYKATTLLASDEPILIERHGCPVGYFIPVKRKDNETAQRLAEILEHALNRVDMSENELIELVPTMYPRALKLRKKRSANGQR